ncbi:zeta toxin [Rhodococcus sp. SMB37]|uniref:AAA family ATPase n=1 Tax=Rhodococcus sp. SMB37 TaxID=2512213 RepID=UPI0006CF7B3E|nr:AAA family ATPase [Rhodococcus sp. SMB37]TCN52128.1 zeta toxin [Rhodococcus sp. SMB37]
MVAQRAEPPLVVIRGASGSGKSTVTKALRHRFGKAECAVVAQDNVRRTILRERDEPGGFNIDLIEMIAMECMKRGRLTIIEGILDTDRYGEMLERLMTSTDRPFFYAFDLSFAQTLDRHATRPEAAEFGPTDMRTWFRGHQPLPFVAETVFDVSWSVEAVVGRIYDDLRSSIGRFGADDGRASGRKFL